MLRTEGTEDDHPRAQWLQTRDSPRRLCKIDLEGKSLRFWSLDIRLLEYSSCDYSYTWAHNVSSSHACQVMQINRSEFQFFFEKTDQPNVKVYIKANEVHIYLKGKIHSITCAVDKSRVIALQKQMELYGNANA